MSVLLEKANNLGFRPGLTQTDLNSHRSRLEVRNFRFKKKRSCTSCVVKTKALKRDCTIICVAKTKVLISCAVNLRLQIV